MYIQNVATQAQEILALTNQAKFLTSSNFENINKNDYLYILLSDLYIAYKNNSVKQYLKKKGFNVICGGM